MTVGLAMRKAASLIRVFADFMLGVRGKVIRVKFKSWDGSFREALIPDDELQIVVTDVLLLETYQMLHSFKARTGIVVDAGAHVGLYTLKVAGKAEKVIAIEPHPANYKLLVDNILRNNLAGKVISLQAILWKEGGSTVLFEGKYSRAHSIFRSPVTSERNFIFPSVTLCELIHQYGDIDLMKMDVEGAEHELLLYTQDEDLKKVSKMVMELHPYIYGEKGIAEIISRFKGLGFFVSLIKPSSQPYSYIVHRILRSSLLNQRGFKFLIIILYGIGRLLRFRGADLTLYAWRPNPGASNVQSYGELKI